MLIASYSIRFHSGYSSPTQTAITEDLGLTVPESFCRILLFSTWEGFGVGIISYTIPVYIAEIAPQNLRGDLGSVNQLSITIGIMIAYLLGLFVQWRILNMKFNDAEETLTKALNKAEQLFGLNTIQQRRG
ncbi:sugar transporter ERD6-like 6 isoform X2 [Euphorbia lathyris]|uniref:sugar transporter ERD6-like 6 isoform X2 n=1 Tax=Euphorbia lathyris TaxID=212925 RepID=UPI00331333BB